MPIEKHMLQTHSLFEKAGEVFEGVAKLKERIAELEDDNKDLQKKLADYHLMSDIRRVKLKEMRRALWLSRAKMAEARKDYWYARSCHEGDKRLWSIDGSAVKCIGCIKRTNFDWLKIWSEVECKCLKKAEEYK